MKVRLLALSLLLATAAASAQEYPARPIRMLLGFGAGGVGDIVARLYAQKMGEVLKTQIVVENRPGANQMIAIRALLAAPPDGYTLYLATGSSLVQNPGLRRDPGYDPLKDFTPIGMVDTVPGVVITSTKVPARTMAEFVAYAKAHPGKLNFASSGSGSAAHLAAEVFLDATGTSMTHIPYRSDADMVREVIAGTVQFGIMGATNAAPAIRAGSVLGLAVTTPARLAELPDVPTLADTGVIGLTDIEPYTLHALVGPAGLPPPIVTTLNRAINTVSAMPEVDQRMRRTLMLEPAAGTPEAFRAFVVKELAKWTKLRGKVTIND